MNPSEPRWWCLRHAEEVARLRLVLVRGRARVARTRASRTSTASAGACSSPWVTDHHAVRRDGRARVGCSKSRVTWAGSGSA